MLVLRGEVKGRKLRLAATIASVCALQISERLLQGGERRIGQPNAFGMPAPLR